MGVYPSAETEHHRIPQLRRLLSVGERLIMLAEAFRPLMRSIAAGTPYSRCIDEYMQDGPDVRPMDVTVRI